MINDVETRRQVKTVAQLADTKGMLVSQDALDARRPNENGELRGWVGGHGGDVVWVQHADGKVAAYAVSELDEIDAPAPARAPAPEPEKPGLQVRLSLDHGDAAKLETLLKKVGDTYLGPDGDFARRMSSTVMFARSAAEMGACVPPGRRGH